MPGARLVRRIARVLATPCPPITPIAFLALALSIVCASFVPSSAAAQAPAADLSANGVASEPTPASETAPNAAPIAPSTAPAITPPITPTLTPTEAELAMMPRATRRAREASLVAVLAARRQVEEDLRELQVELRSDAARGQETEIERRIRARAADLASLSRSFSELATGVDPLSLDATPDESPFDLSREVRALLSPLINEIKRATSRPREIDRLRTEITDLDGQIRLIDKALEQLTAVEKLSKDPDLLKALASERKDWTRRRSALDTTLEVAQQKLDQRAAQSQSVPEAIQEVFQVFFKSRGRNLLLAFAAMAGFFFVFRRLGTLLWQRPAIAERAQTFPGRVFGLVYTVSTAVGAVLVFVIALYLFGDWVLLILALLLLLGLFWASKQALPRFWSQAVLMLDMGAVREGQRVWWNGLPWRVESIAFYCVLVNPALVGGRIRIPLEDIASLRSRPDQPNEPWFPTREGDVVLIDKGRPAIVEFQSTEVVRLRSPGRNQILLPTAQFAAQSHEILSDGYRVDVQFGIDYRSQADITTTTRDTFEAEVERRWRQTSWATSLIDVSVEFMAAGRSSLDYFVRVDLDGSQATDYAAQRRHLTSICVDVCNENGWVIPIAQMTVHLAPPREE